MKLTYTNVNGYLIPKSTVMTRAKGLLCLAIPSKNVSDKVRKELEEFGWNLEVIN